MTDTAPTAVRSATTTELDVPTLYRLLRLRNEVFVVEQACVYQDLDGRDLEPGTVQFWVEEGNAVVATLRLLHDASGERRIGRVATAASARGRGLAARLVEAALAQVGDAPVVLDAQSYLQAWYERFGFEVEGPEFVEDGIPHVPMRRASAGVEDRVAAD
ncbi:MAG: GNAT family N-acetyltransferase [Jatrophihabitans sp.]|uniref:GNAT family N-acetyltransferase n=1 Tax=Jatrophihabitans sp. TaxID=1932789 RepID=UPI003F7D078C